VSHIATQRWRAVNQALLFPDLSADRRNAIEGDIDAAGGLQIVGHELGLADDPVAAGKLLSNRVNENGRHRLSDFDVWQIKQLARKAAGRSRIVEFECDVLKADLHWVTQEEQVERSEQRLESLLDSVQAELQQWRAARAAK
jgi:hypothetical protein